ncbi:MAG: aminotransferase class I/II-fold pyridoxal phosphate-dependent enzyme [Gemmatimonadota bacterium]|nr:aminotransferase class I/II-fold pyridoxal phosphate-dependent enzyme [Gemmatimonadota bacterium]
MLTTDVSVSDTALDVPHYLDAISLGKIVLIREQLLRAQAAGTKVYRFESGDPSFAVARPVLDAVTAAADAGKTHYIPNNGIPQLRHALAEKVRERNMIPAVTSDDIFVTNGAMHALYVTFGALLLPGDEVIVPDPMWTEVVENIRMARGVAIGVELSAADDFEYRIDRIRAAISPRTRAIFVNTPHNPTGAMLPQERLQEILDLARRHDLWIISDEAYEDIVYEPWTHTSIGSLAGDYSDRVISIFSFSKSHAMSGLRLGYIVTQSEILRERIPKLLRCTINGVNSLTQWAGLAAVGGSPDHLRAMRAEYSGRRKIMLDALSGIPGIRPFAPPGAFYIWVEIEPSAYTRLGVASAAALSERLADAGIGSAPGDAFGETCENAIRFAYSCDTKMVTEGSALLRAALTKGLP